MSNITLANLDPSFRDDAKSVLEAYSRELGGIQPSFYVKHRPDGPYLVIEYANPAEHHYRLHNRILAELTDDNLFKERASVQQRRSAPSARLTLPESQLLRNEIAESLTIDKHSFEANFFERYTRSVSGFENQITANANYVVYGRRGAGKSSLLAYAMHTARRDEAPVSWLAMQTFSNRSDAAVVAAVIAGVLAEIQPMRSSRDEILRLVTDFELLAEAGDADVLVKCDRLVPRVRRVLGQLSTSAAPLTVFLDDIHVLDESVQPLVLAYIYKFTRGNNAYIKASGIGQLTRLWDAASHSGLQPAHDAQVLQLDHNLTMPDKSKDHIVGILDAHAQYCGLPEIGYLARDEVLSRLVLVAAGVPRDSLNLFSLAMSKAIAKNERLVSITSINAAASEMAGEKLKDVDTDSSEDQKSVQEILSEVRDFCVTEKRKNAFLVEIKNADPRYQLIQKLAALRLVHLLHEGITPGKAGQRFIALMLDYGFYVGIRAARSVELIPDRPRQLLAKELRSLPIFR